MAAAAEAAKKYFATVPVRDAGVLRPESLSASKLGAGVEAQDEGAALGDAAPEDAVSKMIREAGLTAAEFGTTVHTVIEGLLKHAPPKYPAKLAAAKSEAARRVIDEAETLARQFMDSDLGRAAAAAPLLESEFGIVTLWDQDGEGEGEKIPVVGSADLVFEKEGALIVVDFKTDRVENPAAHALQLAVYRQAVSDIFEKPAKTYLYYLRTGRAVEV